MNRSTDLDAATLRELLFDIGTRMADRGMTAEIAVFGGAALLLTLDNRDATKDFDYIPVSGNNDELARVAAEVGVERGLDSDWFNDSVKMFVADHPEYTVLGDFPPEKTGLRVFMASKEYILAMKVGSMRSGLESHDIKDIWHLVDHCAVTGTEEASDIFRKHFPGEPLPERNTLILDDIFQAKRDGIEYNPMIGW